MTSTGGSTISVVIPTYNRPSLLTRGCLQAIADQHYPRSLFDVIVVNDGGDLSLDAIVSQFSDRLDIVLIQRPHAGPAAARNAGAARARGRHLAFLDDDCVPAKNWLQSLATRFLTTPTHAIGGRTRNALPDNLYSSASQLLLDYSYAYYNTAPHRASFFASNNLALPRDSFYAIGGFDEGFSMAAGEDRDLCDRWQRHGYGMTFAPEVCIYHAHVLTLRAFWTQQFNYGRGAFCFRCARAERSDGHIRLEPWEFYRNLLGFPLVTSQAPHAARLSALFMLSQVANAAGFLLERTRRNSSTAAPKIRAA